MTDVAMLNQESFCNLNPADVTLFFGLLARRVPMNMDEEGKVWATAYGKTFYVIRLRAVEEEGGDAGYAFRKSGKASA